MAHDSAVAFVGLLPALFAAPPIRMGMNAHPTGNDPGQKHEGRFADEE